MAFHIYSAIPARVVSVQIDMDGNFNVVGDQAHQQQVDLNFAKVQVNGAGIIQAPTFTNANNLRLEVRLVNDTVTIVPIP